MKAQVSVTFEFETRAPQTWEGNITATAAPTIVARGIRKAMKVMKPRNWSSMVAVIKERSGVIAESTEV